MQHQFLQFSLVDDREMRISQCLPANCEYIVPYAQPSYRTWEGGHIIEQSVFETGFGFCLLNFGFTQRTALAVYSPQQFCAIQYTLKGEAMAYLSGYGILALVEKTATSVYIPSTEHQVWFDPGSYTFLYIVLTYTHLESLLTDNNHLQPLVQKLLSASTDGMVLERMLIDFKILRLIKELENIKLTGSSLTLALQTKMIAFLSAYNEEITKIRKQDFYLSINELEGRIKLYVLDNILDVDALHIRSMIQVFQLSARTLRRIFLKVFGYLPKQYIKMKRLEISLYLLLSSFPSSILDVAATLGYNNPNNFTRDFTRHFGYPPSQVQIKTSPKR